MSDSVGNLPVQLSDFIGRVQEVNEVRELVSAHRLVTLTGAGGGGKTRLSIEVAKRFEGKFKRGVWFVRLTPLSDPALVPQVVASTMGIGEQKKRVVVDSLIEHLQDRRSLLIFDNCEHLIDDCARLAEKILKACAEIKILATSREPLNIPGELVWTVPPLSLPAKQPWRDPASGKAALLAYEQSESVQLFLNRASLVSPGFELTNETGAWVAEICRRLDGMPLAIELAAARVRTLSVQQIAERLDDRFNLLTSGSRTASERHQTLSATLDWSHELLSKDEHKVLQRFSVFSGGATLNAAESVCAGDGVDVSEVLETLSQLVDKSLVLADHGSSETRYFLLEMIRQYGYEKLIESGEFSKARDRHLNYFMEWAETASESLLGTDQIDWLNRFDHEHDNLRTALEWCHSYEKYIEAELRLAVACGSFWRFRGHMNEGRARLSAALAHDRAQIRTIHRANALFHAGFLAYYQSDFPVVETLAEEALSICRELGGEASQMLAQTLDLLGENATETGNHETALAYFQEALGIFRELDDPHGIGDMHTQIGWGFMRSGELQKARENLEQAQSIMRELRNQRDLGFTYSGLGEVAIREGEYERAKSLLEEGLSLAREIKDNWMIAAMFGSLGWVALNQKDLAEMRRFLRESLDLRTELGDQGGTAWCLEKLANAAYIEKEYKKAAKIFGAAAALRAPLDSVIDDADMPEYNRLIADLKSALGKEAFDSTWAKGKSMPLEGAIELALAESKTSKQSEKEKYGGLTKREREVALWIAQGKSNREIAEEMSVTLKTVETYVTRILNKLGFDSRVQIATWVMEKRMNE